MAWPKVRALAVAAPPQWQPIESAPKDGTRVLVWWPYWRSYPVSARWFNGEWDSYCRLEGDSVGPTHWMPLPAPPSSSTVSPAPLCDCEFYQTCDQCRGTERDASRMLIEQVDLPAEAARILQENLPNLYDASSPVSPEADIIAADEARWDAAAGKADWFKRQAEQAAKDVASLPAWQRESAPTELGVEPTTVKMDWTPEAAAAGLMAIVAKIDLARNNVPDQTIPIDLTLEDIGWINGARLMLGDYAARAEEK